MHTDHKQYINPAAIFNFKQLIKETMRIIEGNEFKDIQRSITIDLDGITSIFRFPIKGEYERTTPEGSIYPLFLEVALRTIKPEVSSSEHVILRVKVSFSHCMIDRATLAHVKFVEVPDSIIRAIKMINTLLHISEGEACIDDLIHHLITCPEFRIKDIFPFIKCKSHILGTIFCLIQKYGKILPHSALKLIIPLPIMEGTDKIHDLADITFIPNRSPSFLVNNLRLAHGLISDQNISGTFIEDQDFPADAADRIRTIQSVLNSYTTDELSKFSEEELDILIGIATI